MVSAGVVGIILISGVLLGFQFLLDILKIGGIPIMVGVLVMILVGSVIPSAFDQLIKRTKILCAIHGLCTFYLGVISACLINMELNGGDLNSYFVKPAVALCLYGSIPAIFIGFFYIFPNNNGDA